jgi:RNA polymerase sigma-70 factor (ECF subfamily)
VPPRQGKRLELRDLARALALLPDVQRTAVLMIGLEGLAYQDAAKIVNIPVGTLRSRLSRGREALRHLMGMVEDEHTDAVMARSSANLAA